MSEEDQEMVADGDRSQTQDDGDEGDEENNNASYRTEGVEEDAPDSKKQIYAELFGGDEDDDEEEAEQEGEQEAVKEEDSFQEYEEEREEKPQQVIGSPLRLVTNPLPAPPKDAMVVRVKLPNIIGIQAKPYTPQSLEEDDDEEDEGKRRKHGMVESMIRWRYTGPDQRDRESNARIVKWSDGSMHLMLGNELLDITTHELAAEHLYLYTRQPGFLHSQGRLTKKVVIRPATLDSGLHQKLSMSLAEKNQKISKVKLVTTNADPEKEKLRREKEEQDKINKRAEEAQATAAETAKLSKKYGGLDPNYLEQKGIYAAPTTTHYRREREVDSYRDRRGMEDFISYSDEDEDEEDEVESRRSKHKKRREPEEDTDRLMNAKRDLSPVPKKKQKEKEKPKTRKVEKHEEAEEEAKDEKPEGAEGGEEETATAGDGGDVGGEEEETTVVKRAGKGRKGVIVDDDDE